METKVCKICGLEFPIQEFPVCRDKKRGKQRAIGHCKKCERIKQKEHRVKMKLLEKPVIFEKKCGKCGGVKPIDCFTKDSAQKTGYSLWCQDCKVPYMRKIYHSDEFKIKQKKYQEKYNAENKQIIKQRQTEYYKTEKSKMARKESAKKIQGF